MQNYNFLNQQVPSFLPQAQGNLYIINNPLEASNVPVGNGISAAVSLTEGVLFLKTLQNGMPVMTGYKLEPLTEEKTAKSIEERLNAIEQKLSKGGKISELI